MKPFSGRVSTHEGSHGKDDRGKPGTRERPHRQAREHGKGTHDENARAPPGSCDAENRQGHSRHNRGVGDIRPPEEHQESPRPQA